MKIGSSAMLRCTLLLVSLCPLLISAQPLDTIFIDFGSVPSEVPRWNNVTSTATGTSVSLSNARGLQTGYQLEVTDAFTDINFNGTDNSGALGYPSSATGDSFYGNTPSFNGKSEPTGAVTLSSLKPEELYTFEIFASRIGTGGENRSGRYILIGASRDTVFLDAAENVDQTAVGSVYPAADGTVVLLAESGPDNNNAFSFYYLNAVAVTYSFEDIETGTGPEAGRDTVQVDFGPPRDISGFGWNNVTHPSLGKVTNLLNSSGFNTGYRIAIVDAFNNVNETGTTMAGPEYNYPPSASGDSFYGNTSGFDGKTEPTAAVELDGLDPGEPYALELFASRNNATDNRQTMYVIEGVGTDTLYLDAASNFSQVARDTVQPAPDGKLRIEVSAGPDNDNVYGFYYLGILRFTYAEIETEQVADLSLLTPNGGEYYQVGSEVSVEWNAPGVPEIVLDYSSDDGNTWTLIDTVDGSLQTYDWTVPATPSEFVRMRISSDTLTDTSEESFTIGQDTSTFSIVVLGSSTAAGNGASVADSSWVNRYRDYLRRDTRFEVVNLAKGGYTTYHIQPTGTPIPDSIAIPIDQQRNVTQALTYQPSAIIVNMPSNDGQRKFPARDQLMNFDRIIDAAAAEDVPVWIATTQPRNFSEVEKVELQEEVRDSILSRYGDRSVDFWTDLTDGNGYIDPAVDSGDGVHVNNTGHRFLFQRIAGAGIDNFVVAAEPGEPVLPATLIEFRARRRSPGVAELVWEVGQEWQLDRYEVERRSISGRWEPIVHVDPSWVGGAAVSYRFRDTDCPAGTAHYRLRMVDTDGAVNFSPIVAVAPARQTELSAYPNPTQGKVTLTFPVVRSASPITVTDAAGRSIVSLTAGYGGKGELDLSSCAPGIYTVRLGDAFLRVVRR